MKRLIQALISLFIILLIINGCSEDDVVAVEEIYSLSGRFTNAEGDPIPDEMFKIIAMDVNDSDPRNIRRDTLYVDSTFTNSVGMYNFEDLFREKTYKIEPFSTAYRAKPDSYYVEFLTVGNNSLHFSGTPIIKGDWQSSGINLPEISPFEQDKELESVRLHVGPGDYYFVFATYSDLSYDYSEGALGLKSTYNDSINRIVLYNSDEPDSAKFTGIFKIYGDSLSSLMELEIVGTEDGAPTPPDPNIGFGSSNAGIDSSGRVFRLIRTSMD